MSGHVVLLGDSIFDNASYVLGGPSVIEHLRRILPKDWSATLLAVDGATMASVERQLKQVPDEATHLVLSVGGNDVLEHAGFILTEPAESYAEALAGLAKIRHEFAGEYERTLDAVRSLGHPLAACTVYDSIPGLSEAELAGLAVFNDAISRCVIASGATLIDLRLTCDEPSDYSSVSPIEPSASGGAKIARAIHTALFETDKGYRIIV